MNYRYISGDSHLEIDSKHWLPRVPEKFRAQAPRLVRQASGGDMWMIGDSIKRPAAAADGYPKVINKDDILVNPRPVVLNK